MTQRGFLSGLTLYAAIGAVAVVGALGIALKIQSARLETCQTEFAEFKMETKRIGEAAEEAATEKAARDLKLKETTDAAHKRTVDRLNRDVKRMRDDNARRSILPAAAPGAASTQAACFDRPELDRTLRGFIERAGDLVAEGAQAVVDLDAARTWAQSLQ